MFNLLAQSTGQPPITVNVPAPVINNLSTGWWWQPIGVIFAGIAAAFLVHLFTQRRERTQKLREAYAEFAAEAYRYLRFEQMAARHQCEVYVLGTSFMQASDSAKPGLDAKLKVADAVLERTMTEATDVVHRVRVAECKLIMLLGSFEAAITEVNQTYRRLRTFEFRTLTGTQQLQHSEEDIADYPLNAQERFRTANQITKIENMRLDIEDWIVARSKELGRIELFGRHPGDTQR